MNLSRETPIASLFTYRTLSILVFSSVLILAIINPAMEMTNLVSNKSLGAGVRQLLYAILLILGIISTRPWANLRYLNSMPWPIIVFFMWCTVTLFWSDIPAVGAKRLTLTVLVTFLLFLTVKRLGYKSSVSILRKILVVTLIANYITTILFPHIGTMKYGSLNSLGEWQGLMGHKNVAGFISSITALIFIFDAQRIPYAARAAVVGFAILFLYMADAWTSIISLTLSLAIASYLLITRNWAVRQNKGEEVGRSRWIILVLAVLPLMVIIYVSFDGTLVLSQLQDSEGFSRRTQIWRPMYQYYLDHVVSGSGFGSYFTVETLDAVRRGGWLLGVSQAHNGYLDIAVQVGLPGLILAVVAVVYYPIVQILRIKLINYDRSVLVASIITCCILVNLGETSIFDRDQLGQVFLMISIALLDVTVIRHRGKGNAGASTLLRRRKV